MTQKHYTFKELKTEGAKHEWEISIPSKPIIDELESQLNEKVKEFEMPGYRKGHVPISILKKQLGPDILSSIISNKVDSIIQELITERNIKVALRPHVEVKTFDEKTSLSFIVKIEALPNLPKVDWSEISVTSYKVEVSIEDENKAAEEIINNFKTFKESPPNYAAKKGDAVVIDFYGTVDGKDFDGNKGQDIRLVLGSDQFVKGFEDQLIGAKADMKLKVRVTFPKTYNDNNLAGKPAVFDVTVKEVLIPESVDELNDEFAVKLGLENVEALRRLIREKIKADFDGLDRLRIKKDLFDQIDKFCNFEVPEEMFEMDFKAMWKDLMSQKQSNPEMFKGKSEAALKEEYQKIAKRRVRLGILLADIARENNLEITEEDIQQAIFAELMLKPGQESMIREFYKKQENIDERLKGPILEEKAVDYILQFVNKKEVTVSSAEFLEAYSQELRSLTESDDDLKSSGGSSTITGVKSTIKPITAPGA